MVTTYDIKPMNNNLLIFIIVALLILGAVYYVTLPSKEVGEPQDITGDGTSVETLEQDLADTELENLDQEFADIDAELEAALSSAD
ncbi:MAG: hypothetical protein G01um101429_695 [Parcubacteria group bacterium Gr01-1014_29]|nr:MAG: hypothetical protein G01um101429_695 [Parcubacteria group bacterium Gr01-1014_29]